MVEPVGTAVADNAALRLVAMAPDLGPSPADSSFGSHGPRPQTPSPNHSATHLAALEKLQAG